MRTFWGWKPSKNKNIVLIKILLVFVKRSVKSSVLFHCLQRSLRYRTFHSRQVLALCQQDWHLSMAFDNVLMSLVVNLSRFLLVHHYMKSLVLYGSLADHLTFISVTHAFFITGKFLSVTAVFVRYLKISLKVRFGENMSEKNFFCEISSP